MQIPGRTALLGLAITLSAGAVLAGAAIDPAAASSSADTVTVTAAGSPVSSVGALWVQATATTPITGITATILSASDTPVLTVTDFALPAGQTTGTWNVRTPIAEGTGPGELPLGSYTISVTATDSGGGTSTNANAGTLNYLIQPELTLSASPTTVDYQHQKVIISGQAVGLWPDGSTQALADEHVELDTDWQPFYELTTGSSGDYQATVQPPSSFANVQVSIAAVQNQDPGVAYGVSPLINFTLDYETTALTARLSSAAVKAGQAVTITGTATYEAAGASSYQPLPDTKVEVFDGDPFDTDYVPAATATTGADGTYSVRLPARRNVTYQVYAGGLPNDPATDNYLSTAQQDLPLKVALKLSLTKFSVSLSAFAVLSVKGCENASGLTDGEGLPSAEIQYAAHRGGPWKRLGAIHFDETACGGGGEQVKGSFGARLASAYYRLATKGSADFQAADSTVLNRWRYLTKITSFQISPRKVARDHDVTVSGRLWRHTSAWHPYTGKKVMIAFEYKKVWYAYKKRPKTSSSGRFSIRLPVYVSAPWLAQYNGDSDHFASATRRIKVSVGGAADAFAGPPLRVPGASAVLAAVPAGMRVFER
ncbi:MAG TPA: hypothetical protein VGG25_00645 [Streptosporangiaceae bacterium]